MILETALALSLLTAEPAPSQMPQGHPVVAPGTRAPPLGPDGKPLPAGHPAVPPGQMAPPLDENGHLITEGSPGAAGSGAGSGAGMGGHPGAGMGFGAGTAADPASGKLSNEELLRQAEASGHLKDRDKPFTAAHALGKLYYANARYAEAAEFLRQAEVKAEPVRAFVVRVRKQWGSKPVPAANTVGCTVDKDFKMETMLALAEQKAKAGDVGAAVSCGNMAAMSLGEVMELRARALFIEGAPKDAVAEYDRLLEMAPDRASALYGRALTRIDWDGDDVAALKLSRTDLERSKALMADRAPPELAHWQTQLDAMIAAGGMTKLAAKRAEERKAHPVDVSGAGAHAGMMGGPMASSGGPSSGGPMSGGPMSGGPMSGGQGATGDGPPQLTKEMVDAVQNTEHTPELEAGLAKLVEQGEDALAQGKFQDALDAYKRVVPFQPDNGRAKAGMAWALVGLGKPMADRIWSVAVSGDPAAVDGLGKTLAAKGDQKGAKALWSKLASTDPAYGAKANLQARLQ